MNPCEFRRQLEDGLAREPSQYPHALVFTFVGRSGRIGIRPMILDYRPDGEKVYGVSRKMAERWLKKFGDDLEC